MAQIYTEQQKVDRTPVTPDTSLITMSDKQKQGGLDALTKLDENQKDFEAKQKLWEAQQAEKTQEEALTNYKNARFQIFQNASTIHSHNMSEYLKTTSEAVAKLDATIPDSKEKINVMASTNIDASGLTARVQKNMMDSAEMRRVESIKESAITGMMASRSASSSLFDSRDENLSPVQQKEALRAWQNSQIGITRAYNMRNAQDANGNFMFSASERAQIKDAYENRMGYAYTDYVNDNRNINPKAVERLRSQFINNKKEIMTELGIDEKTYQKVLKDGDGIISGKTTKEILQAKNTANIENYETLHSMKITADGKVENLEYNNLDSLVKVYTKLQDDENNGYYTSPEDRAKIAKYKSTVGKAIIKQAEDNPTLSLGEKTKTGILKSEKNAGSYAVDYVNQKIKGLEGSHVYNTMSNEQKVSIKAKMYIDTIGQLQRFETMDDVSKKRMKEQLVMAGVRGAESLNNFKLSSTEPYAIDLANSLAMGSYYSQIEGMIGYKPDVPKGATVEERDKIYRQAYFKYNGEASYNYLAELAGLK